LSDSCTNLLSDTKTTAIADSPHLLGAGKRFLREVPRSGTCDAQYPKVRWPEPSGRLWLAPVPFQHPAHANRATRCLQLPQGGRHGKTVHFILIIMNLGAQRCRPPLTRGCLRVKAGGEFIWAAMGRRWTEPISARSPLLATYPLSPVHSHTQPRLEPSRSAFRFWVSFDGRNHSTRVATLSLCHTESQPAVH